MKTKRILTIQDISCVGQCSLTVALPILSAMGIETCILPTAVLSTHTGGFKNFTFTDLTDDMRKIADHWMFEGISFDGIYTGYVGNTEQFKHIISIINDFHKDDDYIVVDPAMADNGKLYTCFDLDFVEHMKELCSYAKIIVPNITEACFLTGSTYQSTYDKKYIESLLRKMKTLGPKYVILTGISFSDDLLGTAVYNTTTDEIEYYFANYIKKMFHGTGDIFASVFMGGLMNNYSIMESTKLACNFVVDSIKNTIDDAATHPYGVHFEQSIKKLLREMEE